MICFVGDLNINYLENNRLNSEANELKNCFLTYGLEQLVERPTYPALNPKSILDIFFTNNKSMINKLEVIPNISENCDHLCLGIELLIGKIVNKPKTITKYDFNSNSLSKLNEELFNTNWFELTQNIDDIDLIYDLLIDKYNEIFCKNIISFDILMKKSKPFNIQIRKMIRNRRNALKYHSNIIL
jgi:hypothetical protein